LVKKMKMIKTLFIKYKELITYVIFGVLTTLVNFFAFGIFTKIFGEDLYLVNNAIAWVVGVVFAYITNKLFVFESKSWDLKVITKEITGFLGARIFSFLVEEGGMFLFVSVLGLGEKSLTLLGFTITGQFIVKILLAVIVVILNYIFSKFFIFRIKNEKWKIENCGSATLLWLYKNNASYHFKLDSNINYKWKDALNFCIYNYNQGEAFRNS